MSHLYCDECDSHFCLHVRGIQLNSASHEQLKTENSQLRIEVSTLKQQVARDTGRLLNLRASCRRLREHQIKLILEVDELRKQVAGQVSFVSTEAADELYAENQRLKTGSKIWEEHAGRLANECARLRQALLMIANDLEGLSRTRLFARDAARTSVE